MKAVLYGQPSAVQSLILAGVSLDAQDSAGNAPLQVNKLSACVCLYTHIIMLNDVYILCVGGSLRWR